MRDLIVGFFGEYVVPTYDRVVQHMAFETVEYIDTETVCPDGLAGVDWPYVAGIATFLVMLWGVVRISHVCLSALLRK